MIEKVSQCHPDKLADRIAGALVDLAYSKATTPKIAVEVLLGHGVCSVIIETSEEITHEEIEKIVERIVPEKVEVRDIVVKQDPFLAANQEGKIRCGDNGIFKGMPLTEEQREIGRLARKIYDRFPTDGKYILAGDKLIICQSCATEDEIRVLMKDEPYDLVINPLGEWTGGISVDSGCTNRKLGSDMADSVTGGGLMGKDCSKADVSVNIYAFLRAQKEKLPVELYCAIGDETVDGHPYSEIVEIAKNYIDHLGGFEKFAEWGLY